MKKAMGMKGMKLDDLLAKLTEIREKEGNLDVKFGDMQPFSDAEIDVADYLPEYAVDLSISDKKFLHIGEW